MARIRSLLGDIEGSAGQITFTKQNGVNILRQKVGRNSSNTPAQQAIRGRFKLLSQLYQSLATLVTLGLPKQGGQSPYNRFVALNFPATAYDNATATARVDMSLLTASQASGAVDQLDNLEATVNAGIVTGQWARDFGSPADLVTAVVIDRRTNRTFTSAPVRRDAGSVAVATGLADADVRANCTFLAVPAAPGSNDRGMTGNVAIL